MQVGAQPLSVLIVFIYLLDLKAYLSAGSCVQLTWRVVGGQHSKKKKNLD